jgi:ParB family chromosome partitioning protein
VEEQLQQLLGVPVSIKLAGKEKGKIVIPFSNNDEFERILRQLRRAA